MNIEFSRHAKVRMKERGIAEDFVKDSLNNPDRMSHLENDKFICYCKIGNKNLVIVFAKKREFIKVITVYYENNI